MMSLNNDYIKYNLEEAKSEIETILKDLSSDSEYQEGDFWPSIQHLFHHINTAWNARDVSPEEAAKVSQRSFTKWRQFPSDLEM